jgi:hypothetical protein
VTVYTPHFAPLVMLAFLGTAGLLIGCLLTALFGALRNSQGLVLAALAVAVPSAVLYGAVLLGFSLASKDVDVPEGAWKYFCEMDCHIAYAIADVRVVRSVGPEMQPIDGSGKFVIVRLKTWFDPSTISPHRGDAPLTPNRRKVSLLSSTGQRLAESPRSQAILAAAGLRSTPLETPLRPGESYVSSLVFEVPNRSTPLRLLLTSAAGLDAAIWGHECSPFHKKAYLLVPAA